MAPPKKKKKTSLRHHIGESKMQVGAQAAHSLQVDTRFVQGFEALSREGEIHKSHIHDMDKRRQKCKFP